MANRAMAAKCERAARQRRELTNAEFSKSFYVGNATLAAGEVVRLQTNDLVAQFLADGGKVTRKTIKTEKVTRRATIRRGAGVEHIKDTVIRQVLTPVEPTARGGVPMGDATPGRLSLSCAAPSRGVGLINRR